MSVFRGSITEYPGVIVDHFIPFNCETGRAFFLSHCHKDHMTGLGTPVLVDALHRRNARLYCSEVTRSLLLKDPDFSHLAPFLKGLPMEEALSMSLDAFADSKALTFTVTLLPAGHCPGSAMFFFQGSSGNVLYTGDFRLTLEETKRLRALHTGSRVLELTTLYLDTTFCHPIATEIPSREVSRDHVLELIESWLSKSPQNVVRLQCSMFGYEHIYMGVARRFNMKVHIAAWRLNAYSALPAVAKCITTDGQSTRIHACNFRKGARKHPGLPCGSWVRSCGSQPTNVLFIKPSTQWFLFSNKSITKPYVYLPECNGYRVIHSMHASYSELRDFVSYLRPQRVVPCVVPSGDRALTDVHTRLKALLPQLEIVTQEVPSNPVVDAVRQVELVSTTAIHSCPPNSTRKRKKATAVISSEIDSDSDSEWTTGRETIDEFPSSEDLSVTTRDTRKSFSSASHLDGRKPLLGLPSMLTHPLHEQTTTPSTPTLHPSSILSSDLSDPTTSSGDSVTVGSLQQTPLDLSFDSPDASGSESTPIEEEASVNGFSGLTDRQPKAEKVDLDLTKEYSSGDEKIGEGFGSSERQAPLKGEEEEEEAAKKEGNWSLSLDVSTESEKTPPGATAPEPYRTPCSKRRKLEQSGKKRTRRTAGDTDTGFHSNTPQSTGRLPHRTPRRLFPRSSSSPRSSLPIPGSHDSDVCIVACQSVDYIDLTHDEEDLGDRGGPLGKATTAERTAKSTNDHHMCHRIVHSPQTITGNSSNTTAATPKRPVSEVGSLRLLPRELGTVSEDTKGYDVIVLSDSQSSSTSSESTSNGGSALLLPDLSYHSDSDEESAATLCSSVDVGGSPLYLPPTPGREEVDSILQRKSIAFS